MKPSKITLFAITAVSGLMLSMLPASANTSPVELPEPVVSEIENRSSSDSSTSRTGQREEAPSLPSESTSSSKANLTNPEPVEPSAGDGLSLPSFNEGASSPNLTNPVSIPASADCLVLTVSAGSTVTFEGYDGCVTVIAESDVSTMDWGHNTSGASAGASVTRN